MLSKGIKWFNRIYDYMGVLFLVGRIICCWLQVVSRFVDSIVIVWTDELAGYMMVSCCFFGAGTATRYGGQLGAYFLRDRLKGSACGIVLLFNAVVSMIVMAVLLAGAKLELDLIGNNTAISMPWLSQKFLYIPLIIGCIYMFIYTVRDAYMAIKVIKTGDLSGYKTGLSSPFPAEVD